MPDRLRSASVQLTSRSDKDANLERAERLADDAAATGADIVLLPEKWNAVGGVETLRSAAEPLEGSTSVEAMKSACARRDGVTLLGGSITERREVISAELDRARVADVRRRLPSLASRRPGAYRWPASA